MAATVHTWHSTTGIWSSVNSWTTGQIPGAGGVGLDTALFDGKFSQLGVTGETRIDMTAPRRCGGIWTMADETQCKSCFRQ